MLKEGRRGKVLCGGCHRVKDLHPNYLSKCVDCGEKALHLKKEKRKLKEEQRKLEKQKPTRLKPPEGFSYCYMCKDFVPTYHMYGKKCKSHAEESKLKNNISHAIKRAKSKGLHSDLKYEQLIYPTHCPVLGIKLDTLSDNINETPSLDRLDNTKGYTVDNVRVISTRANLLKKDATLEEMKAIVKYMEKYNEG